MADMLMRDARVWGPRQAQMKRCLARITRGQAQEALTLASRIDASSKGIAGGDVWNEFLRLGLMLATLGKGRARTRRACPRQDCHPPLRAGPPAKVPRHTPAYAGHHRAPGRLFLRQTLARHSSATTTRLNSPVHLSLIIPIAAGRADLDLSRNDQLLFNCFFHFPHPGLSHRSVTFRESSSRVF